jgi:hypothetical protein
VSFITVSVEIQNDIGAKCRKSISKIGSIIVTFREYLELDN